MLQLTLDKDKKADRTYPSLLTIFLRQMASPSRYGSSMLLEIIAFLLRQIEAIWPPPQPWCE